MDFNDDFSFDDASDIEVIEDYIELQARIEVQMDAQAEMEWRNAIIKSVAGSPIERGYR